MLVSLFISVLSAEHVRRRSAVAGIDHGVATVRPEGAADGGGHQLAETAEPRADGPAAGSRMRPAAFSPIMTTVACVLALGMVGTIDASATRSASRPCTLRVESTTLSSPGPMRQVPLAWL